MCRSVFIVFNFGSFFLIIIVFSRVSSLLSLIILISIIMLFHKFRGLLLEDFPFIFYNFHAFIKVEWCFMILFFKMVNLFKDVFSKLIQRDIRVSFEFEINGSLELGFIRIIM